MPYNKAIAAFTLLELLCSIALGLIITHYSFQRISTQYKFYKKLQQKNEEDYKLELIKQIGNKVVKDLDAHPFQITVQIFNQHSLPEHLKNKLSLEKSSSALAYLQLEYDEILYFVPDNKEYCSIANSALNKQTTKSYIAVSLDGLSYQQASSVSTGHHCQSFQLIKPGNLFIPVRAEENPPLFLIPVKSEYLFYQNSKKQLQLISLKGLKVLEQQTISNLDHVLSFKLDREKHSQLIIKIFYHAKTYYFYSRLNKKSHLMLFNIYSHVLYPNRTTEFYN